MQTKGKVLSSLCAVLTMLTVSACHSKDNNTEAELAASKAEVLKLENEKLKNEVEDLKAQVVQLKAEKKLALNQAKKPAAPAPKKTPPKAAAEDEPLSPAEVQDLKERTTGGGSFK